MVGVVYINEWLPNPAGADTAGEWVELYNAGVTPVPLNGWILKNESGKSAPLDGYSLPARGFLVLRRTATKIPLRNADGGLFLYYGAALQDRAAFEGVAPEGKSFSRVGYAVAEDAGGDPEQFVFEDPTPGIPNGMPTATISVREYPKDVPLTPPLESFTVLEIMMGTALCITGIFLYVAITNEIISQLFFGRNKKNRQGGRDEDSWTEKRAEGRPEVGR